ncbi:MAG: S24 family peptidase [Porphyromonas sp.]|nr:hypothetical protein [Bacteroidales bacterium]MDD7559324.1 S24 family peptidase [Bacteroidales bacterium]MDY3101469.1 S24 family peptidase [Porphyromonas sp.]
MLEHLASILPNINYEWLRTGVGEMLVSDKSEEYRLKHIADITPFTSPPDGIEATPENSVTFHHDLRVSGGNIDNLSGDELSTTQLFISGYEGCHAFPAVGHSMYPTIASGDLVICRRYTDRFIPNGDVFVVITHDQLLVKRITLHQMDNPEDNYFVMKSENPDKETYAPFRVRADEVLSLYKVLAVLKRL